MDIKLHANAKTTPKIRRYIHHSTNSVKELCEQLNLSESTVRKWRKRESFTDRSHTRHNLGQSMNAVEEELIVELRERVGLSIDDITEVMNRCCTRRKLSSSAIGRCLVRRRAVKGRLQLPTALPEKAQNFEPQPFGYVHVDLKHLSKLQSQVAYVVVCIERNTRFVWIDIILDRKAQTVADSLKHFVTQCDFTIHTILTDNGCEFTDRFAKGYKQKPTGQHPFDQVCRENNIEHKLIRPYRPQTNGMVERFNRRLNWAMNQVPIYNPNNSRSNHFANHQERNLFIYQFVDNYNRTRLRCLDYQSPLKVLHNHTGDNTTGGELWLPVL